MPTSKNRNRRYYLARCIKAWDKTSALHLIDMLTELQALAEGIGQTVEDYVTPSDVPTAPLPDKVVLVGVWGSDINGVIVRSGKKGGFEAVTAEALPHIGQVKPRTQKQRRQRMSKDSADPMERYVAARIPEELHQRLEDYRWSARVAKGDILREALIAYLDKLDAEIKAIDE